MRPEIVGNVWMGSILAFGIACGSLGCSLAFVNGPPHDHKKLAYFDCTSSNLLPTGDLAFAGIIAVDAAAGYSTGFGLSSDRVEIATAIVEAAAFAASAAYGYGKTAACRSAQSEMFKRLSQTPPSNYAPGYVGPYPSGIVPPTPAPYDPWVVPPAPASGPPIPIGPLGPVPPVGAPASPPARAPVPASDSETPPSENPAP